MYKVSGTSVKRMCGVPEYFRVEEGTHHLQGFCVKPLNNIFNNRQRYK